MKGPLLDLIDSPAERAKAASNLDGLLAAMAGPVASRFSLAQGGKLAFTGDAIYALQPGTDGQKLLADLEAMMKAPWMGRFMEAAFAGMVKAKLSAKREGDTLVTQMAFDARKAPASVKGQLQQLPFMDGKPFESRLAVAGDKAFYTLGSGGKARLEALRAGGTAAPAGDLATALAETKGDDAVYYVDLAAILKPMFGLATAGMGQSAGGLPSPAVMAGFLGTALADAHLATWGSVRGGESLTLGWRIPMSTWESIAAIARSAMGMK
jgi:hypothetical protein